MNKELNNCSFVKDKEFLDCMLFKNEKSKPLPKSNKKISKDSESDEEEFNFYDYMKKKKEEEEKNKKRDEPKQKQEYNRQNPQKKKIEEKNKDSIPMKTTPKSKFPRKFSLTFTHI